MWKKENSKKQIKSIKINAKLNGVPGTFSNQFNSLFWKPAIEKDINSALKRVKTDRALDLNSISTETLKMSQQITEKPLVCLTNISFFTRVFPDLLKIPNSVPALKKKG